MRRADLRLKTLNWSFIGNLEVQRWQQQFLLRFYEPHSEAQFARSETEPSVCGWLHGVHPSLENSQLSFIYDTEIFPRV